MNRKIGKNGQVYYSGTGHPPTSKAARTAYLKNNMREASMLGDMTTGEKRSFAALNRFKDVDGKFVSKRYSNAIKTVASDRGIPIYTNEDLQKVLKGTNSDVRELLKGISTKETYSDGTKVKPFEYASKMMELKSQGFDVSKVEEAIEKTGIDTFIFMQLDIDFESMTAEVVYAGGYENGNFINVEF